MSRAFIGNLLLLLCLQSAYAELHDPTRPAKYVDNQTAGSIDTSTLELGLTLVSPDRKVVVINGLSLQMGDAIGGEHIVAIESNCVRLIGPGGNITLFLVDKPVKRAVNL
jgi:hypothetical protein